jgi:hypothetical protein
MKSKIVFLTLLLGFLFTSGVFAQLIPTIPGAQGSPFGSYLNDQPPIIGKVTQTPQSPKAGEDVTVTAEIYNDVEKTDDTTVSATLRYSTDDGKTWQEIEMTQGEGEKEKEWKAVIPGQPSGTKVIYYVSGIDTSGNLATEMPGKNSVWPPTAENKPLLAAPVTDPDDAENLVKNDLDYLEFAIGHDDKYVYGSMKVQGKINEGVLSPPSINAYVVGMLNPDRGEDILKGVAMAYAPLAMQIGATAFGMSKPYLVIDERIQTTQSVAPYYSEMDPDMVPVGNTLYWRILKSAFGKNPSNWCKFLVASGSLNTTDLSGLIQNFSLSSLTIGDAAPYIAAYWNSHEYTVK